MSVSNEDSTNVYIFLNSSQCQQRWVKHIYEISGEIMDRHCSPSSTTVILNSTTVVKCLEDDSPVMVIDRSLLFLLLQVTLSEWQMCDTVENHLHLPAEIWVLGHWGKCIDVYCIMLFTLFVVLIFMTVLFIARFLIIFCLFSLKTILTLRC